MIICNPPHRNCYTGECLACPGTDTLKTKMTEHFIDKEDISYKSWIRSEDNRVSLGKLQLDLYVSLDMNQRVNLLLLFQDLKVCLIVHVFVLHMYI